MEIKENSDVKYADLNGIREITYNNGYGSSFLLTESDISDVPAESSVLIIFFDTIRADDEYGYTHKELADIRKKVYGDRDFIIISDIQKVVYARDGLAVLYIDDCGHFGYKVFGDEHSPAVFAGGPSPVMKLHHQLLNDYPSLRGIPSAKALAHLIVDGKLPKEDVAPLVKKLS